MTPKQIPVAMAVCVVAFGTYGYISAEWLLLGMAAMLNRVGIVKNASPSPSHSSFILE